MVFESLPGWQKTTNCLSRAYTTSNTYPDKQTLARQVGERLTILKFEDV